MTVEAIGVAYRYLLASAVGAAGPCGGRIHHTGRSVACRLFAAPRRRRVAQEQHLQRDRPAPEKLEDSRGLLASRQPGSQSATCQPLGGEGAGYFLRFRSIFDSRAVARSTSRTVARDSR